MLSETPATGLKLGIGADGGPGVNVTMAENAFRLGRHVLLLGVAESPDLIALDALAWQATHRSVLILGAGFAQVHQELGYRVNAHVRDPRSSLQAHSFHQQVQELSALRDGQLVHGIHDSAYYLSGHAYRSVYLTIINFGFFLSSELDK